MEDGKKKISCSYALLVIVLFVTVCFLTCYIVIDRKMNKDNNTVQDNNNIVNNNSSSDCVNSNDNINSDNEIDNNSIVSKDFYKNLSDSIANTYVDGYLNREQYAFNNTSYVVSIDSSKVLSLRYSDDYENKYTIASNVVSFFNIYIGNGGLRTLYFIYGDGTVGKANIESGKFENHEFTVTERVDGLKDIVYIYQGSWTDPNVGGGATNPFYVDINGNILGR